MNVGKDSVVKACGASGSFGQPEIIQSISDSKTGRSHQWYFPRLIEDPGGYPPLGGGEEETRVSHDIIEEILIDKNYYRYICGCDCMSGVGGQDHQAEITGVTQNRF